MSSDPRYEQRIPTDVIAREDRMQRAFNLRQVTQTMKVGEFTCQEFEALQRIRGLQYGAGGVREPSDEDVALVEQAISRIKWLDRE